MSSLYKNAFDQKRQAFVFHIETSFDAFMHQPQLAHSSIDTSAQEITCMMQELQHTVAPLLTRSLMSGLTPVVIFHPLEKQFMTMRNRMTATVSYKSHTDLAMAKLWYGIE